MPVTKVGSRWDRTSFEGSLDFFRKDTGDSLMTISEGGVSFPNPYGGLDYYVDGNVSATGSTGLSWGDAFLTLAEAITASNTSIGLTANRWWARRNRIFVCGDQEIDEDLTVLPEKCDVIGIGYDVEAFPRVLGNHVIGDAYSGCRFINMGFMSTAAGPVFTIPANCHGFSIIGGAMWPRNAGSTIGVSITHCAHVNFIGLRMGIAVGAPSTGIFATGVSILGTAGSHNTVIDGCDIQATCGVLVAATSAPYNSYIKNCIIHATAETITDSSDLFHVVNNRLISDATVALAAGAGGITCNELLASGNKIGGKDTVTNADYPFVIQLTS